MKTTKTLILLALTTTFFFSCEKSNINEPESIKTHEGVESLQINSRQSIYLKSKNITFDKAPLYINEASNSLQQGYRGYVKPGYGEGKTTVTATFVSSSLDGIITYKGTTYVTGDSFNVEDFFPKLHSTFADINYIGQEEGSHVVKLKFTTNRNTVFQTTDSFLVIKKP